MISFLRRQSSNYSIGNEIAGEADDSHPFSRNTIDGPAIISPFRFLGKWIMNNRLISAV